MTIPVPGTALATARVISPIYAQLAGASCSALGLTGTSAAPCLALCRALIEHGIPPDTPLAVYRGAVLALRVRSVGEGAQLQIRDNRYGTPVFKRAGAGAPTGSPIAPSDDPFHRQPCSENNAPSGRPLRRSP
jgi:hypothetical protein